jgi:hypothetical protein
MNVICKRSIMFVEQSVAKGQKKPRKHTVFGAKEPQTAPDWMRDTDAFKHAAESGVIQEIQFVTVPVAKKSEDDEGKDSKEKASAGDGKDGKDSKPPKDSKKDDEGKDSKEKKDSK